MDVEVQRDELKARVRKLIRSLVNGAENAAARDALLDDLAGFQWEQLEPWRKLMREAPSAGCFRGIPTDVFRYASISTLTDDAEVVRCFRTSGTTSGARGEHRFADLTLYNESALAAARHALFFDADEIELDLIVLAPHPKEAPDSSLSYMLGLFATHFATHVHWVWKEGRLDDAALERALKRACETKTPVALLGTSFAFVHAEELLEEKRFSLPQKSRVMQTGGFKGRSKEVSKEELKAAIATRYGVSQTHIIAEYSMTELSSQLYETTLREAELGVETREGFWAPGWVRVVAVDPLTLAPMPEGEVGVLRIDDAANVDSCCSIQTADLGFIRDERVHLIGRASGANLRGCSLAVEEALGR